jgi:hypothetical protein
MSAQERWTIIGVIAAVLTAIVAGVQAYNEWRANEIEEMQIRADVSVIDQRLLGSDWDPVGAPVLRIGCMHSHRLRNLGGAAGTIVNYDTVLYYQGTTSVFPGDGLATSRFEFTQRDSGYYTDAAADELRAAIDSLAVKIAPSQTFSAGLSTRGDAVSLTFPYAIDGFSAVDLESRIVIGIVPGVPYNIVDQQATPLMSSQPADLPPLDVALRFTLTTGAVVETPRLRCFLAGDTPQEQVPQTVKGPAPLCPASAADISEPNALFGVTLDPASPRHLAVGDRVQVKLLYRTDQANGIGIFAMPVFADRTLPRAFEVGASPVYPSGEGSALSYATVLTGTAQLDRIRLSMEPLGADEALYACDVPARYEFVDRRESGVE